MWEHLNNEQEPPVRDRRMRVLYAERDEPAERAGHGGEAEPVAQAEADLVFDVKERFTGPVS